MLPIVDPAGAGTHSPKQTQGSRMTESSAQDRQRPRDTDSADVDLASALRRPKSMLMVDRWFLMLTVMEINMGNCL